MIFSCKKYDKYHDYICDLKSFGLKKDESVIKSAEFVARFYFLCSRSYYRNLKRNFDGFMNIAILTPRISKHYLLLVAAIVWTFAGGMLLKKGFTFMQEYPDFMVLKLLGCLVGGLAFFAVLFRKISGKHVVRIQNMPIERPCFFSFFNFRSYLLMSIMISSGIILRKTGVVSHNYLSLVYITMGIPLLLSSFRFYLTFFRT